MATSAVLPMDATMKLFCPRKHWKSTWATLTFMTSLARGLTVLETFTQQTPHMTISQLSKKTGLSRAAVRRCLYTLGETRLCGV